MHNALKLFKPETQDAVCAIWKDQASDDWLGRCLVSVPSLQGEAFAFTCCPIGAAILLEFGNPSTLPTPYEAAIYILGKEFFRWADSPMDTPEYTILADFMSRVDACSTREEVLAIIGCEED